MKRILVCCVLAALVPLSRADTSALEKRVAALEQEVAVLKTENQKLKDSALDFLSTELAKKETEHARFVYRTQVLPMVKSLVADFGSRSPAFPKEDEIRTLADAYRPFVELIASLSKTISGN